LQRAGDAGRSQSDPVAPSGGVVHLIPPKILTGRVSRNQIVGPTSPARNVGSPGRRPAMVRARTCYAELAINSILFQTPGSYTYGMKPAHVFKVVPSLPAPLEGLRNLAYNLRWSWDHNTIELLT
jgi:hypothetical protein